MTCEDPKTLIIDTFDEGRLEETSTTNEDTFLEFEKLRILLSQPHLYR